MSGSRDMGQPFPTVRSLARNWPEILIGTGGLSAAVLIAWAIHPMLLGIVVGAAISFLNVKLRWLKGRQERLERLGVPKRRRKG